MVPDARSGPPKPSGGKTGNLLGRNGNLCGGTEEASMSVVQWLVACLWVAGTLVLVALVLAAVAFADPEFRHRSEQPKGDGEDEAGRATLVLVARVLAAVAFADPEFRHRSEQPKGDGEDEAAG